MEQLKARRGKFNNQVKAMAYTCRNRVDALNKVIKDIEDTDRKKIVSNVRNEYRKLYRKYMLKLVDNLMVTKEHGEDLQQMDRHGVTSDKVARVKMNVQYISESLFVKGPDRLECYVESHDHEGIRREMGYEGTVQMYGKRELVKLKNVTLDCISATELRRYIRSGNKYAMGPDVVGNCTDEELLRLLKFGNYAVYKVMLEVPYRSVPEDVGYAFVNRNKDVMLIVDKQLLTNCHIILDTMENVRHALANEIKTIKRYVDKEDIELLDSIITDNTSTKVDAEWVKQLLGIRDKEEK